MLLKIVTAITPIIPVLKIKAMTAIIQILILPSFIMVATMWEGRTLQTYCDANW